MQSLKDVSEFSPLFCSWPTAWWCSKDASVLPLLFCLVLTAGLCHGEASTVLPWDNS